MTRRPLLAPLVAFLLAGCGEDDAPPPNAAAEVAPAPARITPEGPVGLYVRVPFPTAGANPEPAAWYFAPDGFVYENPRTGFAPADLAAHKGRRGQRTLTGGNMSVAWAGGRSTTTSFSPAKKEGLGFSWDLATFRSATPLDAGKPPAARWTAAGDTGTAVTLRLDGTYEASGTVDLPSPTGTWKASGWSIALTDDAGATTRHLAFPVDDGRLYLSGRVWRRSGGD
jgi:hypothetical protein